jgi:hypothetical protein
LRVRIIRSATGILFCSGSVYKKGGEQELGETICHLNL